MVSRLRGNEIPRLLESYAELLHQERLRGVMAGIPANPERQIALAMELIERRAGMAAMPQRLLECIVDFCKGLNHRFGKPAAEAVPAYEQANATYFQPFLKQHGEDALENYLVWSVLRRRFPFGDELLFPNETADAATEFSVDGDRVRHAQGAGDRGWRRTTGRASGWNIW